MNNETTTVKAKTTYAGGPLKVGDKVGVRYHSDIKPGTVIKATATTVLIQLHEFKLLNGPTSGEPDALVSTPGGFCAHVSGTQRNEIDGNSNAGTIKATFRKNDLINGQTGVWRQVGYTGGRGKIEGVIYGDWIAYYDFNF
jgi:hypothetical protein